MGEIIQNKNVKKIEKEGGRYEVIAKYFLLNVLLSFFGWAFETTLMWVMYGKFFDRGFLHLPLCPIYGTSLMITYFLLGTPDEGRGILKRVENPLTRYVFYALFAFLIPTAAELVVGFVFDVFYDTQLWSYTGMPLNFRGYVSVPISLGWMAMIFLFMKYLFPWLKKTIFKTPKGVALSVAVVLLTAIAVDAVFSYMRL